MTDPTEIRPIAEIVFKVFMSGLVVSFLGCVLVFAVYWLPATAMEALKAIWKP